MSSEIAALRAQLVQSEQQRLRFAQSVQEAAQGLVYTCQAEMMEHAQLEAEQLVTLAATEQDSLRMALEQLNTYDLTTLHHDPFANNDEVEKPRFEE